MKTRLLIVVSLLAVFGCNDSDPIANADWKRVDLPTNADLHVISFINKNVGFIGAAQKANLSRAVCSFMDGSYYDYIQEIPINSDSTRYRHVEFYAPNPEPVRGSEYLFWCEPRLQPLFNMGYETFLPLLTFASDAVYWR